MKFNIASIEQLLSTKLNIKKVAQQLTDIGFEVDGIFEQILEINVPPNRGDCLGFIGIAREIAAANGIEFDYSQGIAHTSNDKIQETANDKIKVTIENKIACPRYLCRIIKNIDINKKTPEQIAKALQEAEIQLISPVVDITNYVMLEFGQPVHAFDLDIIGNEIIVRNAKPKETITLLNEQEVQLNQENLIIANTEKPLAIAGIMGGLDSGINSNTRNICLECAFFDPIGVRLTAKQHKLLTDSSYRFERGVDSSITLQAMNRLTELLLQTVGGQPSSIVENIEKASLPKSPEILLKKDKILKILGICPEDNIIENILHSLKMQTKKTSTGWQVQIPIFRQDLTRAIDLIEELARHIGYNNIPEQAIVGELNFNLLQESCCQELAIKQCLVERGYHEIISYSFVSPDLLQLLGITTTKDFELLNPISKELSVMRPSLLPSLLATLQYNQNRQNLDARFFEIGLRFFAANEGENDDTVIQRKTLAGLCCGNILPESWTGNKQKIDFFNVKADIMALLKLTANSKSCDISFAVNESNSLFHPGQSVIIKKSNQEIGVVGALHPKFTKLLDLQGQVLLFEVDYSSMEHGRVSEFIPLSRYPKVRRDLALVVDRDISASNLQMFIANNLGDILKEIVIFDLYQGERIAADKKSIGIGLILQHSQRTLVDSEVNTIMQDIIAKIKQQYNAILRD